MQIIKTIEKIRPIIREAHFEKKLVGFVPTMGSLHPGHLSLVEASKKECDYTVMSIFVNPIQFDEENDLNSYPRELEADIRIAEEAGVDILFFPEEKQMYSKGFATYVEVCGQTASTLCGVSRPGHFRGVATVVCKLLNIVQPDKTYFGLKDAQQGIIISRMIDDLNLPVEMRLMPSVREKDGLAYSSRNKNLSKKERKNSLVLYRALLYAKKRIMEEKARDAMKISAELYEMVGAVKGNMIDYISFVNLPALEDIKEIKGTIMIAIAVYVGKTKLIDNIVLKVDSK
jgi:pantoate--beta-alanine ligase